MKKRIGSALHCYLRMAAINNIAKPRIFERGLSEDLEELEGVPLLDEETINLVIVDRCANTSQLRVPQHLDQHHCVPKY